MVDNLKDDTTDTNIMKLEIESSKEEHDDLLFRQNKIQNKIQTIERMRDETRKISSRPTIFWLLAIATLFLLGGIRTYSYARRCHDNDGDSKSKNIDVCIDDDDNNSNDIDIGSNNNSNDIESNNDKNNDSAACEDFLLGLSDEEIWSRTTDGNKIGAYCIIYGGKPGNACSWYAAGRPNASGSYRGVPLSRDNLGTGCVVVGSFCYFRSSDYDLTDDEVESMCTLNYIANAAAQIRYGIRNGRCTDEGEPLLCDSPTEPRTPSPMEPSTPSRTKPPTPQPTPDDSAACVDFSLRLSDEEIWSRTTDGNRIGTHCRISKGGPSTACDWYAKGRPNASGSYNGVPLNRNDLGTGCVAVDSFCYYRRSEYDLTDDEVESMCTLNYIANAAAQIRYGIRNGRCTDEGEPLLCDSPTEPPTPSPTESPTPSPTKLPMPQPTPNGSSTCVDFLLSLSDEEIWSRTTGGNTIGTYCRITEGGPGKACDWYASGRPNASGTYSGVPLSRNDLGTGCVAVDSFCYYRSSDYDLTDEEVESMCTLNYIANAAAQIRYGIRNGRCTDEGEPLLCD